MRSIFCVMCDCDGDGLPLPHFFSLKFSSIMFLWQIDFTHCRSIWKIQIAFQLCVRGLDFITHCVSLNAEAPPPTTSINKWPIKYQVLTYPLVSFRLSSYQPLPLHCNISCWQPSSIVAFDHLPISFLLPTTLITSPFLSFKGGNRENPLMCNHLHCFSTPLSCLPYLFPFSSYQLPSSWSTKASSHVRDKVSSLL